MKNFRITSETLLLLRGAPKLITTIFGQLVERSLTTSKTIAGAKSGLDFHFFEIVVIY